MAVVLSTKIKDMYAKSLQDSVDAANKSNEAAKVQYDYNISNAPSTYDPQRNQAYTDYYGNSRTLRERMANMGLGAGGGTSVKANNTLANNLSGTLTNIGTEQQNYINQQTTSKSQLDTDTAASIAKLQAENQMGVDTALVNQTNIENARYLQMLLNGSITMDKYKKLTGTVI